VQLKGSELEYEDDATIEGEVKQVKDNDGTYYGPCHK